MEQLIRYCIDCYNAAVHLQLVTQIANVIKQRADLRFVRGERRRDFRSCPDDNRFCAIFAKLITPPRHLLFGENDESECMDAGKYNIFVPRGGSFEYIASKTLMDIDEQCYYCV
jgi:hypothetical protein